MIRLSGKHEFLDFLDLPAECLIRFEQVGNRLARMEYRCMITSADSRTDGRKRCFRVLFGQVHGDLARFRAISRAFCRVEPEQNPNEDIRIPPSMIWSMVISF